MAELTPLVRACGNAYGFTEAEHADALRAALADPADALECFRRMAGELPSPARTAPARTATAPTAQPQPDTRPACTRCRHRKAKFNPAGYCGQRQDLPPVYGDNHPLRRLPDDGGTGCARFEVQP